MIKKRSVIKIFFRNQYIVAFLGILVIILISYPLAKNLSKTHKINQEINDLKNEINELDNTNFDLKKVIDFLESDSYLEKEARLNLGLKMPGEEVVVIKEKDSELVNEINGTNGEGLKKLSNFSKWFNYFFKK